MNLYTYTNPPDDIPDRRYYIWCNGSLFAGVDSEDQARAVTDTLNQQEQRIAALETMLERVSLELAGTHAHLQDIINGDVTGDNDPLVNYERLVKDLREARELDLQVIEQACALFNALATPPADEPTHTTARPTR